MEHGRIIKVAEGQFPFHFWIAKAVASSEMGKMVVEGVASTGNVDHDKERMAPEALKSMARIINTTGVPLRVEHSQNDNAVIGSVNKAWIDERNQLWIKAVLDESHPASGILYKGLKDGVKMGLSVGGYVKRAVQEMVEGLGKTVNTFYDVLLDEVSVTQKPSNYDARLMAKSFAKSKGELDALESVFERDEFLFHSAMGAEGYLQAISKSVKESDWQEVSKDYKLKDNSMSEKETDEKTTKAEETDESKKTKASETDEKTTKAEETDESKTTKAEDTDDKTTKSVSRREFNELSKQVAEGFNAMTAALTKMSKALDNEPVDQEQPRQGKEDPEAGKDVSKVSGGEAVDGEQPKEAKKDPEAGKDVSKTSANGTDETGEREKAKKAKEDTYDLETVERAVKRIKAMTDDTDKTTKAAETDETRTEKSAKMSSLDVLATTVADYIERLEKRMKEDGFQTDHVAKTIINNMRSNPEFRKDMEHFIAEPGRKRSLINGTPFVKMKDGRMFALKLDDVGERTEKSADAPKDFKSMWGTKFSSTPQSE